MTPFVGCVIWLALIAWSMKIDWDVERGELGGAYIIRGRLWLDGMDHWACYPLTKAWWASLDNSDRVRIVMMAEKVIVQNLAQSIARHLS